MTDENTQSLDLAHEEQELISELIKTISILSGQSDLISIVNSYGDTLADEEFLIQLKEWNIINEATGS